jgi:hypothetical protein
MVNETNTYHVATQLVRQVHRTIKKHDATNVARQRACRILAGRVGTLVEEASWHPAGSPEAALMFAAVLAGDIEGISEGEETDLVRLDRMHRLAISLIHFIERTAGISRENYRLEWFAPTFLDGDSFGEPAQAVAAA